MASNAEIDELFTGVIVARGGTVTDRLDEGRLLYLRSVLPRVEEARPSDEIRAGVALMAGEAEVRVHPYTLRAVCSNGAIFATALQSRRIDRREECSDEIREAVQICSSAEAFADSMRQIRSAMIGGLDLALSLLMSLGPGLDDRMLRIMDAFFRDEDKSPFALMNAITAAARETDDPETRWNLEELGGGIVSRLEPPPRSSPGRVPPLARVLSR
jgi:hypothetical protein